MIEKGSPEWAGLKAIWESERRPGYIIDRGGMMYRVFTDGEEVKFAPMKQGLENYESNSMNRR